MSLDSGTEYQGITSIVNRPMFQSEPGNMIEPADVVESMTGQAEVRSTGAEERALQKKFMNALDSYNSLDKQVQEEIMRNQTRLASVQAYLGKRSRRPNGDLVYVNDYGYTTTYVDSDSPASSTCNSEAVPLQISKTEFLKDGGTTASPSMPCGLAGKNIKNEESGEIAWVDVKGKKHVYPADVWAAKQAACNVLPILLSPRDYELIPAGDPMQTTSDCLTVDVDPHLWAEKQKALHRLMQITEEVDDRTYKLEAQDAKLGEMTRAAQQLRTHAEGKQDRIRRSLNSFANERTTTAGELESTHLVLVSRQLQLIVWLLVCLTVCALLVHAFLVGPGKLGSAVLLAACLVGIYLMSRSLWRYFK